MKMMKGIISAPSKPFHDDNNEHDDHSGRDNDVYEEEEGADGNTTCMRRLLAFSRLKYFFSLRLS